jgi:hypothetical protein
MSRLVVSLVAFAALAGCASVPYKQLRIDGTSEAAFKASVESLREALPTYRRALLAIALRDIWRSTATEADPASSEADTAKAYFARVDRLGYHEIIDLADATPPTTRQQYYAMLPNAPSYTSPLSPAWSSHPVITNPLPGNASGAPVVLYGTVSNGER